jgi:hypothetical protein
MTYSQLAHHSALLVGLLATSFQATAQQAPSPLRVAVPILTLSPDARSAALGESGVALAPDANATYYNAGKLGFAPNQFSLSASYTPWLATITDDGGLLYLSGYGRLGKRSTLAGSVLRFSPGLRTGRESAYSISYGRTFGQHLGVGATARYSRSTINRNLGGIEPGKAISMDIGVYYTKSLADKYNLGLGASIANIGTKMTYSNPNQRDFLPMNLRVGAALTRAVNSAHALTLTVDATKLLVPSPYYVEGDTTGLLKSIQATNSARRNKGILAAAVGSFSDAPGGFREELREINLSTGLEYSYRSTWFARVGYYYENPVKGDRNYLGVGLGGRYRAVGLDGAYLIPNSKANPLAQTLRFSLHVSTGRI